MIIEQDKGPMITPTLFIGLGTTGAEVLGYLQDFIFEECLTPNFPIFKLLTFVTAASDTGFLKRSNANPNVRHITVPDMDNVRSRALRGTMDGDRALREWIPDRFLQEERGVTTGSGSNRAMGRLQLWENMTAIRTAVDQAASICTGHLARQEANKLFHRKLTGKDESRGPTSPMGSTSSSSAR